MKKITKKKKTRERRKGRELKVRKCDKTAGIEKAKITKKIMEREEARRTEM